MNIVDLLWSIHRINIARQEFNKIKLHFDCSIQERIVNYLNEEEIASFNRLETFYSK